jgi:hypothetical protein
VSPTRRTRPDGVDLRQVRGQAISIDYGGDNFNHGHGLALAMCCGVLVMDDEAGSCAKPLPPSGVAARGIRGEFLYFSLVGTSHG